MKRTSCYLFGAIVAHFAQVSHAVAVEEQQAAQATSGLEEIVVTAQKREERLKDVPISISVLGGKDLDQASFQGVTEALTSVPGVSAFPYNQGGGSSVAVRGVTTSYPVFAGPSPIAYYLDGVPFGLVDSGIAPDANAYDMNRVEVLRGPQGTLYGASALNGVVRILTKDADLNNFEAKVRASDSTTDGGGNNYRGDLAVNVPLLEGKLAARAVLGYEDLSGWIDKPNVNNANNAVLRNARLKINAQPTDELSIGLSAWLSHQDYGAPSQSNDEGRTDHLVASEPIATDYGAYGLKVGYAFPTFSITSNTSNLIYANHDDWDYGVDYFGFSTPIVERFNAHVFSEEVNITSTQQGAWRWTAGGIYRDAQNTNFQTLPDAPVLLGVPVILDWTDSSKSYAIFGEVTRLFLDGTLEWTVGGRYFHDEVKTRRNPDSTSGQPGYYGQDSFNATTPRTVLTWHPTKDETIYASYSEGFRSGAPEPYYIGVTGFPSVKPDKLHNYELGAKADLLNRRLSVDAALYYMKWDDVQQQLTVPFNSTFVGAIVNGQSASGVGVDLGVTVRPLDRLEVSANFSWNDLSVDSNVLSDGVVLFAKGDRLNFSAKYTAGGSARYSFPLGGSGYEGRLSASASYASALSDRGIAAGAVVKTDGNSMLISRMAMSVHSPTHWEASLFADNINNERGAVYRLPLVLNPDASARVRPRTVGLQVEYQY